MVAGSSPAGPTIFFARLTQLGRKPAGSGVYFLGAVRAARMVAPIMARTGGGAIINISTFATFEPDPDFPTSAVYRAGLASYAKLFANQHAKDNMRMNNVLPGRYLQNSPAKQVPA